MRLPTKTKETLGDDELNLWRQIPIATKLYFGIIAGLIFLIFLLILIRIDFFSFEWMQFQIPSIREILPQFNTADVRILTPVPGTPFLITTEDIEVYSGPGLGYKIIGNIRVGVEVALIGNSVDGKWWAINYPEKEEIGWIAETGVRVENIPGLPILRSDGKVIPNIEVGAPKAVALVNTEILSKPGDDSNIIGYLDAGQLAALDGRNENGTWWAIKVPYVEGGQGWVSGDEVLVENIQDIVIVTPISVIVENGSNSIKRKTVTAVANVNIRSGPGLGFTKIGIIANGQQVDAVSTSPDGFWIEIIDIDTPTGKGWISVDYVVPNNFDELPVSNLEQDSGILSVPTPDSGMPTATAVVIVNIRSGPGLEYAIQGRLEPSQQAEIIGISPDKAWWKIKLSYQGQEAGWVAVGYVQTENTDNVPIVR